MHAEHREPSRLATDNAGLDGVMPLMPVTRFVTCVMSPLASDTQYRFDTRRDPTQEQRCTVGRPLRVAAASVRERPCRLDGARLRIDEGDSIAADTQRAQVGRKTIRGERNPAAVRRPRAAALKTDRS